jgi:arylsulfatase A-like enzyme
MYAAEIHYADRELGRLLAALDGLAARRDTVVVVVGDHGESLGEHGIYYGHDGIYEQQLRIPLIIHVPGLGASRSDALVTTLDLVPTISELTGVRLRRDLSGSSLVPLLAGEDSPALAARDRFVHQHAKNLSVALRDGGWKLIWPIFKRHRVLPNRPQLFNLREDPQERVDLAAQQPERVRAMRRELLPWIKLGRVTRGDSPELDDEALEHLRALGYLAE